MYSGGSGLSIDTHFVDIELSYDVLSPLPTLLSKHFNHPHPYIEIATAISDNYVKKYMDLPRSINCSPETRFFGQRQYLKRLTNIILCTGLLEFVAPVRMYTHALVIHQAQ